MQRSLFCVLTLAALGGIACSPGTSASSESSSPAAAAPAADAPAPSTTSGPSVQNLKLTTATPTVGAEVRASASGLPAGKTIELGWKTVSGGWVIEDYYHFRGKKYEESTIALGRFPIDASGQLDATFRIPEDFGGVHDVVGMVDGTLVTQGGIEVTQSFEITPASGPIGTPIEIKVTGLGWRTMESTWVVN